MSRALAALRRTKIALLRAVVRRAERAGANGSTPPAILAGHLLRREERVFAALGGGMSFQILRAAHRVGLFALLHARPGLRAGEIAEALALPAHATEVLLLGLVSTRLLERIEDRHYVDPILSGLLSGRGDGGALAKMLAFFDEVVNPAMAHLEESVRSGHPKGLERLFGASATSYYEAIGKHPRLGEVFREAMRADTAVNRDRVAESSIFAGRGRILDVGGNLGELAMAIAAHHPAARVSVLDFPDVAELARRRFEERGLNGRIDAIGQDLREGPLPKGYDVIVFAHFLDIFSRAEIAAFFAKAYEALPVGGTVCVFGSVMNDDERGPAMYGVLSSYFLCLADGRGRFYTVAQITQAMRAAGFEEIERTMLPRSEVVLQGMKRAPGARPKLAAFVRLGRPKFLAYSLLLYGLGSAAIVHEGRGIDPGRWIHGIAFVWLAHLMTHYCNERFDLAADAANPAPTRWTGGSRVLVDRLLSPRTSLATAVALLFGALLFALTMPDGATRALAVATIALGWFYTAPPVALNYRGLGEVAVAAGLNLAVPLLAYGVAGGRLAPSAPLVGVALTTFVAQGARMLVMNLSDHDGDRLVGKRTLAVVLGPPRARRAFAIAQGVVYAAIVAAMAARVLPVVVGLAMLLTAPLSLWLVRHVLEGAPREAGKLAFAASTQVALLVATATIGLLASAPLPLAGAAGASLALCAAIVTAFAALLAAQVRRAGLERASG